MTVPLNWYQSHHPARARASLYLRSHMFSTRQIFIWPLPRFAKLQYYLGKEALRTSITPRALCAFRIEKKKTTVFQSFLSPTKSPDLRGKLYSAIHPPTAILLKDNTNLKCSHGLQRSSLILDIHVMTYWHLSKQGIPWPVSRDHSAGTSS